MSGMKNVDLRAALLGIPGREEVTFKRVLLIVLCTAAAICLNFGGSLLAEKIVIPLYLDSIMTLFVTASFGLIPGMICAAGSNLMLTVFVNSNPLFMLCHFLTVIFAWLIFFFEFNSRDFKGEFTVHLFLAAAFCSAVSNGILGNVIVDHLFSSVTGRPHADIVVQGIFSAVPNRIFATYFGGLVENLTDKVISACVSFGAYKALKKIR